MACREPAFRALEQAGKRRGRGREGGCRLRRILVEDVVDTSDGKTYFDGCAMIGVNVGDSWAYSKLPASPDDVSDITVRHVRAFGRPLLVRGSVARLTAEDIADA